MQFLIIFKTVSDYKNLQKLELFLQIKYLLRCGTFFNLFLIYASILLNNIVLLNHYNNHFFNIHIFFCGGGGGGSGRGWVRVVNVFSTD